MIVGVISFQCVVVISSLIEELFVILAWKICMGE